MDRVVLPKAKKKEIRALDKQGLSRLLGAVRGTSLFPLFVTAASTRVPAWGTSCAGMAGHRFSDRHDDHLEESRANKKWTSY
jgi:hypothetical protein